MGKAVHHAGCPAGGKWQRMYWQDYSGDGKPKWRTAVVMCTGCHEVQLDGVEAPPPSVRALLEQRAQLQGQLNERLDLEVYLETERTRTKALEAQVAQLRSELAKKPQPAGKEAAPAERKNPLAGRGPGVYVFRRYWANDATIDDRIEANSAQSAAKAFVRQFAKDRDTGEWASEDDYRPYRGAIQIEVVTSPLDTEPVYQGYRRPDPNAPWETPEYLLREPLGWDAEDEAMRREWAKMWDDGHTGPLILPRKMTAEDLRAWEEAWAGTWKGEGPPLSLYGRGRSVGGGWYHTVPEEVRAQWTAIVRAEREAARQ
jgi:cytochrome c553